MTTKLPLSPHKPSIPTTLPDGLIEDLRGMIEQTRKSIASTVNTRITMLYWHVGNRVRKEILKEERAEYGRSIVASVARQLTLLYGKGFSEKSLRRMLQFGELFHDEQIVASLLRQLSWTHFTLLIPIKDPIKSDNYADIGGIRGWESLCFSHVFAFHQDTLI